MKMPSNSIYWPRKTNQILSKSLANASLSPSITSPLDTPHSPLTIIRRRCFDDKMQRVWKKVDSAKEDGGRCNLVCYSINSNTTWSRSPSWLLTKITSSFLISILYKIKEAASAKMTDEATAAKRGAEEILVDARWSSEVSILGDLNSARRERWKMVIALTESALRWQVKTVLNSTNLSKKI